MESVIPLYFTSFCNVGNWRRQLENTVLRNSSRSVFNSVCLSF